MFETLKTFDTFEAFDTFEVFDMFEMFQMFEMFEVFIDFVLDPCFSGCWLLLFLLFFVVGFSGMSFCYLVLVL